MLSKANTVEAPASARVPSVLSDLWRRRLDTIISGIANNDTYYLQIANAAEQISAEYQGRFLIELIQKANDQTVRQGLTDSLVRGVGIDVDRSAWRYLLTELFYHP